MGNIDFYFKYPLYFVLIIPFLLFLFVLFFKKSSKRDSLFLKDLLIIYKRNSVYYKLHLVFIFFIFLSFLSIFSKPILGELEFKEKKKSVDIEIVFDLSYSMMATDLKPTRLEVAKEVLGDFINNINSDRVGMIIFSGKPFNGVPLTFDYDFIKIFINNLHIDIINRDLDFLQGTAIGDSLLLAGSYLKGSSKDRGKVIILITDGDSNKGIDIKTATKYAKENNIRIYTIGIGGDKKTFLEIKRYGFTQQIEVKGINESILKYIAKQTGGYYYRAKNKIDLTNILKSISKLEKKEIEVKIINIEKNINNLFIFLLLFLFSFYFYFSYKKILILNK